MSDAELITEIHDTLNSDMILERAKGVLTDALVIGLTRTGEMYVSGGDGPKDALWLLRKAEHYLLTECS